MCSMIVVVVVVVVVVIISYIQFIYCIFSAGIHTDEQLHKDQFCIMFNLVMAQLKQVGRGV